MVTILISVGVKVYLARSIVPTILTSDIIVKAEQYETYYSYVIGEIVWHVMKESVIIIDN